MKHDYTMAAHASPHLDGRVVCGADDERLIGVESAAVHPVRVCERRVHTVADAALCCRRGGDGDAAKRANERAAARDGGCGRGDASEAARAAIHSTTVTKALAATLVHASTANDAAAVRQRHATGFTEGREGRRRRGGCCAEVRRHGAATTTASSRHSAGEVPQHDVAVAEAAAGDDEATGQRHVDVLHTVDVAGEHCDARGAVPVPHAHRAVHAARHDDCVVVAEARRQHHVGVALQTRARTTGSEGSIVEALALAESRDGLRGTSRSP